MRQSYVELATLLDEGAIFSVVNMGENAPYFIII